MVLCIRNGNSSTPLCTYRCNKLLSTINLPADAWELFIVTIIMSIIVYDALCLILVHFGMCVNFNVSLPISPVPVFAEVILIPNEIPC